jgi:hypothetical protein
MIGWVVWVEAWCRHEGGFESARTDTRKGSGLCAGARGWVPAFRRWLLTCFSAGGNKQSSVVEIDAKTA